MKEEKQYVSLTGRLAVWVDAVIEKQGSKPKASDLRMFLKLA